MPILSLLPALLTLLSVPTAIPAADDLPPAASRPVDFEREVRPLLVERCLSCHDAEKRKGGLRLDRAEDWIAGGDSGPAIEVGRSAESLLIEKVAGLDAASVMPPKGDRLTAEQVGVLRAWIDRGAIWSGGPLAPATAAVTHWSLIPPVRPAVPDVGDPAGVTNPIDRFIRARLDRERMTPGAEADRRTLIRRLALDLVGLPPRPEEVDAFVADDRPDAYERLVDRLLASPRFGERWGRRWLDLARYADTNGYEKDRERPIWPYRDWVIAALNGDQPFDQFTVEQLAGDLIPGATSDQKVATGFHRNTMLNEEGGIDVEEYRFNSVVDRVATTGAVWLGLTVGCAQCHTHKYDPITQREYYQLFAFLNNADEPELELPDPEIESRRSELTAQIRALEADLAHQFPLPDSSQPWTPLKPSTAAASSDARLQIDPDGSVLVGGPAPETDRTTLTFELPQADLAALRLEALTHADLPSRGPGRTRHGNFVVTGLSATVAPLDGSAAPVPLAFETATADVSQPGFDPAGVLDADPRTGWAIDDGSGKINQDRALTLRLREPLVRPGPVRLVVTIAQEYGGTHTLGRMRVLTQARPVEAPGASDRARERAAHLARRQAEWERGVLPVRWTPVAPSRVESRKRATLTVLGDQSVLATGDKPNNDVYEVELPVAAPATAIRLEALPDASLPDGGPGRAPLFSVGDFILTEVEGFYRPADGGPERPVRFARATEDFAEAGHPAALAIDGQPDTGWTLKGGMGAPHAAVFELAEPVPAGGRLRLNLHQFGIHQMTLGRFRLSLTGTAAPVSATSVPAEVEAALLVPEADRDAATREVIRRQFLAVAPELQPQRAAIAALKRSMPRPTLSLVMQERPPVHRRSTAIHKRGEYLKPTDPVEPGVPAVLPPLPSDAPRDRLTLARWLVDPAHPLTARVTVNRLWHDLFGRGLVATVEDFGVRGEPPSHPELLDWLAVEFVESGWSTKALLRRIVTSATYRQSSHVTPEALARDPRNELLARAPRLRVEAEVLRDQALAASGLLVERIGGPSVFPPQPPGATALAYSMSSWPTSQGPARYRRGVYTFLKRTAPFAASITFDGPTSDTTCARRDRSNTPLQALTLLNDPVFVEAADALADRLVREGAATTDERIATAYRLLLAREPRDEELTLVRNAYTRFLQGATTSERDREAAERRAWRQLARALLNLDETITRE